MAIASMSHFTVLTDDVDATRAFYCGLLGLVDGKRPPFGFPGLWLYAGDRPILHVIGRAAVFSPGNVLSMVSQTTG